MPANNCQQNSENLSIKQPIRIYYVKHNPKYFKIYSFPEENPAPSKTSHIPWITIYFLNPGLSTDNVLLLSIYRYLNY